MKPITVVFMLLCFGVNFAQEFSSGWLPKINTSYKFNSTLRWVNSIEARETVYDTKINIKHSLIDVSSILSIKTSINHKFNVGYIIRFQGDEVVHRTLQQYTIVQPLEGVKLAHRLGFEQFFKSQLKPEYRSRYRISAQLPLSGLQLDVKEYYLKFASEYLYDFNADDIEFRVAPFIGYQLSRRDKLELGFDYRLNGLLENSFKQRLWFRTTWYVSF